MAQLLRHPVLSGRGVRSIPITGIKGKNRFSCKLVISVWFCVGRTFGANRACRILEQRDRRE